MKNNQIYFNTRYYENEYGHSPKGRGSWFFSFEGYEFFASGTYSEAKKACIAEVKKLAPADFDGEVEVKVLT